MANNIQYKKIGKKSAFVLVCFAAAFDLLSFTPFANEFVTVVGQVVMGGLFYLAGVNVLKDKPGVVYGLSTLVEAIPVLSALPFFVIETLTIIAWSRNQAS